MAHYLDSLNKVQREAVLQKAGPIIIIAGAGSGKTRVLTYRVAHLIQQGIDAFNILSLTFTNKAAREMKERIAAVIGSTESKNLWMGTFHSVFAKILRAEAGKLGYPSNFTIYDTQDSVRLIGSIIKEMALDKDLYKAKQIFSRISSFKNSLITVRSYFNNSDLLEADSKRGRPKLGHIYKEYTERCFKSGAMDFDDLLLKTNELLALFPEVLAKYQDRFRYIMVDEYQDTNHSQYIIVKALADRFQNICVVGDDSQSIYSFRGANIQNILNFQKDYPEAKVVKLEQNYRSTQNIVNAANSVIEKNKTKLEKRVWTSNPVGEQVKVMCTTSDGEEGRFVAQSIFDHKMNSQLHNDQFAVLYRTNSQSRSIEDALRKKGINYIVYGGVSFYGRKEIKDLMAYLRILINPNDEEALKRIINYPARGIGATTIDKLTIASNHYKRPIFDIIRQLDQLDLKLHSGIKTKLQNFQDMILCLQIDSKKMDAFQVTKLVIEQTHLIQDLEKEGTPEAVNKVENVQELLNGVKDFITDKIEMGEDASLPVFLQEVALATDLDSDKKDGNPKVSLMSIHQSKGLEYPYVYIVGLEENLFPSAMSMNTRSDLEEERRLFYVALTRAEKVAYLTYTKTRYRWGKLIDCERSRFLEEINQQYLEYIMPNHVISSGNIFVDEPILGDSMDKVRFQKPVRRKTTRKEWVDKRTSIPQKNLKKLTSHTQLKANLFDDSIGVGNIIDHNRFGRGVVLNLEGKGASKKAEIHFNTAGKKKLLLQFAKLKVIG